MMDFILKPEGVQNSELKDLSEIITYLRTKPVVGIACAPIRAGVVSWMHFLEYNHFPPGTVLNADLQMVMIKFCEMTWSTIIFPRTHLDISDKLAAKLGLLRKDGVPHEIYMGNVTVFPLNLPNVFTLEHVPGHFVYKNRDEWMQGLKADSAAAEKFFNEFTARRLKWVCGKCGRNWVSGQLWKTTELCATCS